MTSKKTMTAEKDLAELRAKLAKARAALDDAFENDDTGDRIPALTATVGMIERRIERAEGLLQKSRVLDAVAEIDRLKAAHAESLKKYHAAKVKYEADTIKLYEKPSIGKKIARDRKLAPAFLVELRRERHDALSRLLAGYEALRDLDPAEAAKLGYQKITDYTPPARPDGRVMV
jgi:lipase chaperone LimK